MDEKGKAGKRDEVEETISLPGLARDNIWNVEEKLCIPLRKRAPIERGSERDNETTRCTQSATERGRKDQEGQGK